MGNCIDNGIQQLIRSDHMDFMRIDGIDDEIAILFIL